MQRVSIDPPSCPPSEYQYQPALAYNPSVGNALVAWHDHGHYDQDLAGYWGIWGRLWLPLEHAWLPLVMTQ